MRLLGLALRILFVFILCSPLSSQENVEKDFDRFQQALLRAESVSAQTYAPELVQRAQERMADARLAAKKQERISAIEQAISYLQQAYEKSLAPYSEQYVIKLNDLLKQIEASGLGKYAKDEFQKIQAQVQQTIESIQKNHINEETRFMFDQTWQNLQNFSQTTTQNLKSVTDFMQLVRDRCVDLLSKNPNILSSFTQAEKALENGELEESLSELKQTMDLTNQALATDDFWGRLKKVDAQLFMLKDDLQKANSLLIIRAGGVIEHPNSFDGNNYLAEHPLVASPSVPALFQNAHYTNLELLPYDITDIEKPRPSKIEVAGEMSSEGLYEQAVSLWKDGVTLRNAGHLDEAVEYFERSKEYLIAFKREAVAKVYTVQKRANQHDTLWRIAGFKDIYNNPYLWPLLWERNKMQITDPDRLEPGQKLLVPAID